MDGGRNDIVITGLKEGRRGRTIWRSVKRSLLTKHLRSPFTAVMTVLSIFLSVVAFSLFPVTQSQSIPSDIRRFFVGGMPMAEVSFRPWFESWGFTALLAFFSVAMMVSLAARIRAEYRRAVMCRTTANGAVDPSRWHAGCLSVLASRRFRLYEEHRGAVALLRASKRGGGVLGSILFHASLLMLIMGIFLGRHASMEGTVALTEGQEFDASDDRFGTSTVGRFYGGDVSNLRFKLVQVEPDLRSQGATTPAIRVLDLATNTPGVPHLVHVNRSASIAGYTIHLGGKMGYAPLIRVEGQDGSVEVDGYTRLASLGEGPSIRHRDLVRLHGEPSFLEVELIADDALPGWPTSLHPSASAGPTLMVSAYQPGVRSQPLSLHPGESGVVLGRVVSFGGVRRWAHVGVSDDPALPFLLIACLLGTAGLLVRLLWVRREIVIRRRSIDGRTVLFVSGTAEKYPESFKEQVSHLVDDMRRAASPDVEVQHTVSPSGALSAVHASDGRGT